MVQEIFSMNSFKHLSKTGCVGIGFRDNMSRNLNSAKAAYIRDYIGDYYRGY